jgi:hypothetical protein
MGLGERRSNEFSDIPKYLASRRIIRRFMAGKFIPDTSLPGGYATCGLPATDRRGDSLFF